MLACLAENKNHARKQRMSVVGGTMKVTQGTAVTRVPGNPSATTRTTVEWVCPDCDYFEEAEKADIES